MCHAIRFSSHRACRVEDGELAGVAADELGFRWFVRGRGNETASRRSRLRAGCAVTGIDGGALASIEPVNVVLKVRCCAGGESDGASHNTPEALLHAPQTDVSV